jgi:hypothetical protein
MRWRLRFCFQLPGDCSLAESKLCAVGFSFTSVGINACWRNAAACSQLSPPPAQVRLFTLRTLARPVYPMADQVTSMMPPDEMIEYFLVYTGKRAFPFEGEWTKWLTARELAPMLYWVFLSASSSRENAESLGIRLRGSAFTERGIKLLNVLIHLVPHFSPGRPAAIGFVLRCAVVRSVLPKDLPLWLGGQSSFYRAARHHQLVVEAELASLMRVLMEKSEESFLGLAS